MPRYVLVNRHEHEFVVKDPAAIVEPRHKGTEGYVWRRNAKKDALAFPTRVEAMNYARRFFGIPTAGGRMRIGFKPLRIDDFQMLTAA